MKATLDPARDAPLSTSLDPVDPSLDKALDQALALETPHTPGPGFDTRFFARLEHERGKQRRSRWWRWSWALVPIAAGVALVLVRGATTPTQEDPMSVALQLSPDDVDLALDLELVQELPVVERLDELEDFELLADIDDAELMQLAAEAE